MTTTETERTYVPAAGRHWRLPFYDLLAKLLGADRVRAVLVEQASAAPTGRILEIGTGTGSLLLLLKRAYPRADVIGLDPDPKALALARGKAERAGMSIQLDQGFAEALPYEDESVDLVVSAFMFHHLRLADKERTLLEVRRVLRPGGWFHMMDFTSSAPGLRGFLARRIHADRHLRDSAEDRVLEMMSAAGLTDAVVSRRLSTRFARVSSYQARARERAA